MKLYLVLAYLCLTSFISAKTFERVTLVDVSFAELVTFLGEAEHKEYIYEPNLIKEAYLNFDSGGPIAVEKLEIGLLLLLELNGISCRTEDNKTTITQEDSPGLEEAFALPVNQRLPENWISNPYKEVSRIELENDSAYSICGLIQQLSGTIVLFDSRTSSENDYTLTLSNVQSKELVMNLISLLEADGFRFLYQDGFLLVRNVTGKPEQRTKRTIQRVTPNKP